MFFLNGAVNSVVNSTTGANNIPSAPFAALEIVVLLSFIGALMRCACLAMRDEEGDELDDNELDYVERGSSEQPNSTLRFY